MNLQESIRRILREEVSDRTKDRLIDMIQTIGFEKTSNMVGGEDNLKKITGIYNSRQFMKLFLNLTPEENSDNRYIDYKNKKGKTIFTHDTDGYGKLYISFKLISEPLYSLFEETRTLDDRHTFLSKWFSTNYDITVSKYSIYSR